MHDIQDAHRLRHLQIQRILNPGGPIADRHDRPRMRQDPTPGQFHPDRALEAGSGSLLADIAQAGGADRLVRGHHLADRQRADFLPVAADQGHHRSIQTEADRGGRGERIGIGHDHLGGTGGHGGGLQRGEQVQVQLAPTDRPGGFGQPADGVGTDPGARGLAQQGGRPGERGLGSQLDRQLGQPGGKGAGNQPQPLTQGEGSVPQAGHR
ncbi:MAG: hypothetical protein QM753_11095 [Thermomicrobiales bacterium]